MATISAVIQKGNQKSDGTWNVNIRIWHKGKPAYIETNHWVNKTQLGKKSKDSKALVIKDMYVLDRVAPLLKDYRDWISDNVDTVERLTAVELKAALLSAGEKPADGKIDFLAFCKKFIDDMKKSPRSSSSASLGTVYNSLVDYFKSDSKAIDNINYNFLKEYEQYLRKPRIMIRPKNKGGTVEVHRKGLSDAGLHNHMRDLRLLFNEARNLYNDEDRGIVRIPHYPFKKYKVGSAPITEARARPISEIIIIMRTELQPDSRAEMARDLGMLSLYMLGMNAADMYELPPASKIGSRYGYNRSKTRNKRKDNAFISVKVIPEARVLLKKYAGTLQKRYSTIAGLNTAIDKGLQVLSEVTGIPDIDFYDWRHCVGTWSRRICGFSKDDTAEALNQAERTVTDIYIAPDWSLIDRIQASIVALIPLYGPHINVNDMFKKE